MKDQARRNSDGHANDENKDGCWKARNPPDRAMPKASTVDPDLNTLPKDAEVKITTSLKPEPEATNVFQLAAAAAGMESADIAYVINVTRTNLENVTDIKSATIIMKAGTKWVETHGGADAIRIFHYDPESKDTQVLETRFRGYDE